MADECLSGRHSQKQAPTPEAVLKEIGSGESDESAKENRKEEQLPPVASREEEAPLEAASESGSAEARRRPVGDVVEVAQGPRREPPQETQRVKGKAAKDGKVGRVSLHDPQGSANLELTKPLIRKASVARHRGGQGRPPTRRRGGPRDAGGIQGGLRVKARAKADGTEGWVTMKGKQGTASAEASTKHHVCKRRCPLDNRLATSSNSVRKLE